MNVLGSGWVHNHYGMRTAGFEGFNYSDENVTYEAVKDSLPTGTSPKLNGILYHGTRTEPYCPIDWQIDLKSGARYDIIPAKQIKFGIQEGVDAKMSADMNRLYPWVTLGRAYAVSGERKYLDEVCLQFIDWVYMNPADYGAAWRGNMNVAIRVVNMIAAFSLLAEGLDPVDDAPVLEALYNSLREHRRSIAENLEFTEEPSALHPNHYIANLCGLLTVSTFLSPFDCEAAAWARIAARELRQTFDWQTLSDGVNFEATTMYHAFVLEMLVYTGLLCARMNGARTASACRTALEGMFGTSRTELIHKMFTALRDMAAPDGWLPVVGDADSGRFLYLESCGTADRDRRFLLPVGSALFEDSELCGEASAACAFFEDASRAEGQPPVQKSAAYPEAGFYIMRAGTADYAFVCAAPIGTDGKGCHAHNDRLEVLLTAAGEEIIMDPGVYAYTASRYWRNINRDIDVHATVKLAGLQPNRLNPPGAWWGYRDDTQCKTLLWDVGEEHTVFEGEHYAYQRLELPVTHRRRAELSQGRLLITDRFLCDAADPGVCADYAFTLAPQVRAEVQGSVAYLTSNDVTVTMRASHGTFVCAEGHYAPVYGANAPTARLELHLEKAPTACTIEFTW